MLSAVVSTQLTSQMTISFLWLLNELLLTPAPYLETQYLKEEMANVITTFFNECLLLESRLSTLRSYEQCETSNLLKGLLSVLKRDLNYERVHLSTACNLFNQFCTPSRLIRNYMADFVDSETIHQEVVFEDNASDDDENDFSDEDLDNGMY